MVAKDPSDNNEAFTVAPYSIRDAVVLPVRGDIDMLTAPLLTEAILGALSGQPAAVIVDLSEVEFLASAGMTALVTAQEQVTPTARFSVVADGPGTSRPIKLMGIDTVVPLYHTLDQALAAYRQE